MFKKTFLVISVLSTILTLATEVYAHCQIPCGIFDDHARVLEMREHLTTIDKSVRNIQTLAGKTDALSANQLTRWVNNKEQHAEKIIRIISDYFMAQKIKPALRTDKQNEKKYLNQLAEHHAVLVAAMKCKQSADLKEVKALEKSLDIIEKYWPESK